MVSFTPLRAETEDDRRRYLDECLTAVRCLDCAATVRVRKNSAQHTSIQWTADAQRRCAEFARLGADPGGRAVGRSCPALRASIAAAVDEGRLPVGDGGA